MSNLRKAAEQAVEAIRGLLTFNTTAKEFAAGRAASAALRAALAEPTVPSDCPWSHQPGPDAPCRYPDCVDNGPEGKCMRWLLGECEKSEDYRR